MLNILLFLWPSLRFGTAFVCVHLLCPPHPPPLFSCTTISHLLFAARQKEAEEEEEYVREQARYEQEAREAQDKF